jgi:hypothetical protein
MAVLAPEVETASFLRYRETFCDDLAWLAEACVQRRRVLDR